jgi:hypothetical protein
MGSRKDPLGGLSPGRFGPRACPHRRRRVPTEREGTEIVENEPLANTPAQALDWFLRTKMDLLVMGDVMIRRE